MEFAIVTLPGLGVGPSAGEHSLLQHRELVVRGDDAAFPLEIAGREGKRNGISFEEQAHRGNVAEALTRHRRDLKAALAFCDDQGLRRQAAENFAQRADARAIRRRHPLQPKPRAGLEASEDDVLPDPVIGLIGDRSRDEIDGHMLLLTASWPSPLYPRLKEIS